jgi:hypothetical protein
MIDNSDQSPPLSAKIQSQKNILSSSLKRVQHYQQYQTQNMNDLILEENEDTEDEAVNIKFNLSFLLI